MKIRGGPSEKNKVFTELPRGATDHGKPVLRIVPIREKLSVSQLFAGLQGQVLYHEDVDTPTLGE